MVKYAQQFKRVATDNKLLMMMMMMMMMMIKNLSTETVLDHANVDNDHDNLITLYSNCTHAV